MKKQALVWTAVPEVYALMKAVNWPRIPQQKNKVEVRFGAHMPVAECDLVIVSGGTDQPVAPWATSGTPGKNDTVNVSVSVYTNVPGFDELRTWAHLAELGTAIDLAFRDETTGRPQIPAALRDAGVLSVLCSPTSTQVTPAGEAGAASWMGSAEFTVALVARI